MKPDVSIKSLENVYIKKFEKILGEIMINILNRFVLNSKIEKIYYKVCRFLIKKYEIILNNKNRHGKYYLAMIPRRNIKKTKFK